MPRCEWSSSRHASPRAPHARRRSPPAPSRASCFPTFPTHRMLIEMFRQRRLPLQLATKPPDMSDRPTDLFRAEAISYHDRGAQGGGNVLRISPDWIPAAYWLLLAVVAAGAAYGTFGMLTEYATGPA